MSFLRVLTLICFGFGLFVQVAAQAAAVPQVQSGDMTDCMEMAQSMQQKTDKELPDQAGSCQNMTLGCLVAMNCVPPLALADAAIFDASLPAIALAYSSALAYELDSRPIVPESPPPQNIVTV